MGYVIWKHIYQQNGEKYHQVPCEEIAAMKYRKEDDGKSHIVIFFPWKVLGELVSLWPHVTETYL